MSKITAAARGQRCTIMLPGCLPGTETVVFCHSNESVHGKGVGKKSDDIFGAFGCQHCHDVYDRKKRPPPGTPYPEVKEYFHNGNGRTVRILIAMGLVKCS